MTVATGETARYDFPPVPPGDGPLSRLGALGDPRGVAGERLGEGSSWRATCRTGPDLIRHLCSRWTRRTWWFPRGGGLEPLHVCTGSGVLPVVEACCGRAVPSGLPSSTGCAFAAFPAEVKRIDLDLCASKHQHPRGVLPLSTAGAGEGEAGSWFSIKTPF